MLECVKEIENNKYKNQEIPNPIMIVVSLKMLYYE